MILFNRTRYFQLIDALVTRVVLDRRGLDQEWFNAVNVTVSQVLSKMADQEKLTNALEEAKEAKTVAEKALREKQELQNEISSGAGNIRLNYLSFIYIYKEINIYCYTIRW